MKHQHSQPMRFSPSCRSLQPAPGSILSSKISLLPEGLLPTSRKNLMRPRRFPITWPYSETSLNLLKLISSNCPISAPQFPSYKQQSKNCSRKDMTSPITRKNRRMKRRKNFSKDSRRASGPPLIQCFAKGIRIAGRQFPLKNSPRKTRTR